MSRRPLLVMLLVPVLLVMITGLGMALPGEPLATFTTTFFIGSGDCASCHSNLQDEAGQDVSFAKLWRPSMMANSAKDPLWIAKVESEVLRTPALQGAIEEKCSTCHMPMAYTQAKGDGTTIAIFDEGFLNPENELHVPAKDGISCALCHQIGSEGLGDPETFSGNFPIDITTTTRRDVFGRYPDPVVKSMASFDATLGEHMGASAGCATCHTLYTNAYDSSGNLKFKGFPEQVPYLEWEESSFSGDEETSCQDCHMPAVAGPARIAKGSRVPAREDFGRHYFDGGNTFMLAMLRDQGLALEVTASSREFRQAIARTADQLAQDTAKLTVTESEVTDELLAVELRVQNLTGHKFPTGIPIRRAWIHLTAVDAAGETIFESGAPLADGRISGNDNDEDQTVFEPHYTEITAPDQVQIYETVMADWNDELTYTLLRATAFAKDNRLLPDGFNKVSADDDVQVFGEAADDDDFAGGQDLTRYEIAIDEVSWPVTVSAELLFQPVAYSFVQDLAEGGADFAVRYLDFNDAADQTPALISRDTAVLEQP